MGTAEIPVGESRQGFVGPGVPNECDSLVTSVSWSVENPAVASVTQLGARNANHDTAGAISRAWVTGLAPGQTVAGARIAFSDGAQREAEAAPIRIIAPAPPPRKSFVVAQGTGDVTFNNFTGSGATEDIVLTLPAAGRVDVSVDWSSFGNNVAFFLWEGICSGRPCAGRLVVEAQQRPVKPRREAAENLAAGAYTLGINVSGAGPETVRYEVRLTPN